MTCCLNVVHFYKSVEEVVESAKGLSLGITIDMSCLWTYPSSTIYSWFYLLVCTSSTIIFDSISNLCNQYQYSMDILCDMVLE